MATHFQGVFHTALQRAKKKQQAPAAPPPGTYDPQFDAQGRQNQRGYDDLLQNFAIGKQRGTDDLATALANLNTGQQRNSQDLATALGNIDTAQQRNTLDRSTALGTIGRNYASLARRQAEGDRQANVESAGILAQSLAKRQANQAIDQTGVNTAYDRATQDNQSRRDALNTSFTRGTQDNTTQSDALKLAFDRAYGPQGDNVVNVARAGRDLTAGQLDLNASKWYGATANGYAPVPRPKKKRTVII